jgi:hypothetical protein
LLLCLYCTLDDAFPEKSSGPGRPLAVNDAELVCIAIAGVLLASDTERAWLRRATRRIGHLFPVIPRTSDYNWRLKRLAARFDLAIEVLRSQYPEAAGKLLIVDTSRPLAPRARKRSCAVGWAQAR